MNKAKKPVFAQCVRALCLCLTLFYAASLFMYLNSPSIAEPMVMADMEDCHMDMGDMQAPKQAPSKSCCNVVGCCPMLTPMAFTPQFTPIAMPLQLAAAIDAPQHYLLASRLDRPPRA